jgi:hypothetical protein
MQCIIALRVQNVENIGVLCFAFIYCRLPWQPKYIFFYLGEMSIFLQQTGAKSAFCIFKEVVLIQNTLQSYFA